MSTGARSRAHSIARARRLARRDPGILWTAFAWIFGLATVLAAAAPVSADMVVSGEIRYVDRAFTYESGWTGEEPELPVRLARVLVLDAFSGEQLAEGSTDLAGHFAIAVQGHGTRDVIVRCLAMSTEMAPDAVVVQPNDGAPYEPYSVSSPTFAGWDLDTDLDAGLTVAQKVVTGSQQGNPFNLLDMTVDGFGYIASLGLPPSTEPLVVSWPSGSGSSSGGKSTLWMSSSSGYNDVVLLHELGHSIDFRYSEPDTPAGAHSFGQSDQHPSLSLSEGFASFFAGAVRQWAGIPNPGFYFSGTGNGTTGPGSILLRMDYETRAPYKGVTGGEADEVAVCAALWNLVDTASTDDGDGIDDDPVDGSFLFADRWTGDQLIFRSMTGDTVMSADSVHVIDLWDGLFVDAGADHFEDLAAAFEESKIAVRPDAADPDDVPEFAVPVPTDGTWSPTRRLVKPRHSPPVPGAGDLDWIMFDLPAGTLYEIETRYPNGKIDAETYADTLIEAYDVSGKKVASADFGGVGRNAKLTLATTEAGSYRAVVRAAFSDRRTGRYQVAVRDLGPVKVPVLTSVTPPQVVSVSDNHLISLTLDGEGFIGTQRVTVGGADASFWVQDDSRILATLPLLDSLGPLPVAVENAAGQVSMDIVVAAPDPPAINVNAGFLYWSHDVIRIYVGAEPGDLVYLFLSFSDEPTLVPGVLDLAIGAQGEDLVLIDVLALGPGGSTSLEFRRPDDLPGITNLWMQGAVQRAAGPPLPLVSTNVEPGVLIN